MKRSDLVEEIGILDCCRRPVVGSIGQKVPCLLSYSESFVIARMNGLEFSRDVNPNADLSRLHPIVFR